MKSSKYPNLARVWTAVHEVFGDRLEYSEEFPSLDESVQYKDIELYLVGGCVRDTLLEKPIKDYDFCTNLTPDEMIYLVKKAGKRVYDCQNGRKYGTIGFKVQTTLLCHSYPSSETDFCTQDYAEFVSIPIECTTYRTEKYHAGSRKPEVEFSSSLDFDLSRRDFTINAMAFTFNKERDDWEIIDKYAGRLDLRKGLIKAVGDCHDRFKDDPLRMLRAIRFANKYDFQLENNMRGLISKMKNHLFDISIERIVSELDQILLSPTPDRGISLMSNDPALREKTTSLLSVILPEVYDNGVYERLDKIKIDPFDPEKSLNLRWKRLLSQTGTRETKEIEFQDENITLYKYAKNPQLTKYINRGICARMKFSNQRTKIILGE